MTLEDHIMYQTRTADILHERGYTRIHTNCPYDVNGIRGEVDIIATSPCGAYKVFIEVKSCMKKLPKAIGQFHKYKAAFPQNNIKGFFVTRDYVKRIY